MTEQQQPPAPTGPKQRAKITVTTHLRDAEPHVLQQVVEFTNPTQLMAFMGGLVGEMRKIGGILAPMRELSEDKMGIDWTPLEAVKHIEIVAEPQTIVADTDISTASILARARASADAAMRGKVVDFPGPKNG